MEMEISLRYFSINAISATVFTLAFWVREGVSITVKPILFFF